MEVDEIQRQVCKFQRVSSNGSTTTTDNSSNPNKIDSSRANLELQNHVHDGGGGGGGGSGGGGGIDGGVARLCGWPSSRIVRVSRASGGKDRHSKVLTSKGLRDRRVRLSVGTAIQFYDLQDRLGYDQPSKAVEWLLKAAAGSIDELPSLDLPFHGGVSDDHRRYHHQMSNGHKSTGNGNVSLSQAKTTSCSSASETSKGSELSLSRSENRMKARDRARERAKTTSCTVFNEVNGGINTENSSFTDLLTGGINTATATAVRSPMEYFYNRPQQLFQPPQFNITTGDNLHHFSFLQDSYLPPPAVTTVTAGGGEQQRHNLTFSMTSPPSSSSGGGGGAVVAPGGFTRGTLQSNLPASLLPHHQRTFQSSSIENATNHQLPFFIVPTNTAVDHFQANGGGGYHLSYGGGGGGDDTGRHSVHQKEKSKN